MIGTAISRSLKQIDDPVFRKVILWGVLGAAAVFIALFSGLAALLPMIPATGIGWLDSAIGWIAGLSLPLLAVLSLWLLFPAVATTVMSFFLEDIVDAVEARHYPEQAGGRASPLVEQVWLALKMMAVIIVVNLLALPAYLALLFTGFGAPLLYLAINAYLLGREYFEVVALRHGNAAGARSMRRGMRDQAFLGGLAIAGLFMVPIANLLAPVLGAAIMVHLFHGGRRRRGWA